MTAMNDSDKGDGRAYLVAHLPDGSDEYVVVSRRPPEAARAMLAAAVCAEDLWALVEAVREWKAARLAWGTDDPDGLLGVELIEAETDLSAALARLDDGIKEESDEH